MSARGAPDIERKIVRFGVLSLCKKAAAHFLHTVCTFARIRGFSAQGLHSLLSFAQKEEILGEQGSRQLSAFVCVHQPDGFKDLLTGDFCCRRLFVLPGLRCCRGQVLGIEVRFDLLGQLQPGLVLRVGVGVHQDRCRCMTCVALHRLEVTVRHHSTASREFRPHGAKGSCSCAPPDAGQDSRWSATLPAWFSRPRWCVPRY